MRTIDGDIFGSKASAILHQVNCQGVMGSGVAKQVKERYPTVFWRYKQWCDENKEIAQRLGKNPLLGKIQIVYKEDFSVNDIKDSQAIVNLYAQDRFGRGAKCYTDYDALRECLMQVDMAFGGKTVAIPYMMSCGRGGGNWSIVSKIIEEELRDCDVTLYRFRAGKEVK